jgi:excisionase family DNA binding protein
MELDWMTPQQAAKQWNISDRRIQELCAKGRIDGAVRLGRGWLIPKSTPKPADGRIKAVKQQRLTTDK